MLSKKTSSKAALGIITFLIYCFTNLNGQDLGISDGGKIFSSFFTINNNECVTYKVTTTYQSNAELASHIGIGFQNPKTSNDFANKKIMDEAISRIRNGYTSISVFNLYISNSNNIAINEVSENEWNKGLNSMLFFSKDSLISIDNKTKTVLVTPPQDNRYPSITAIFPQLLDGLGLSKARKRIKQSSGTVNIGVAPEHYPLMFFYEINIEGLLQKSSVRNYKNLLMRNAAYEYTGKSKFWPSKILTKVFNQDESLKYAESWELQTVNPLEKDFTFTPAISKDYHVIDKTGANVPSDEISKLIKQ